MKTKAPAFLIDDDLVGAQASAPTGAPLTVSRASVIEDPDQPRRNFDAGELAQLAETIRKEGIMQPITVRPANDQGVYVIVTGGRRFRASGLAGLSEVPIFVDPVAHSPQALLVRQIIENDSRSPLTTIELIEAVNRLKAMGNRNGDIAQLLHRRPEQVTMLAALSDMSPGLKSLAEEGAGLAVLYHVLQIQRQNPAAVEAWLQQTPASEITKSTVARFAKTLSTGPVEAENVQTPTTPPPAVQSPPPPHREVKAEQDDPPPRPSTDKPPSKPAPELTTRPAPQTPTKFRGFIVSVDGREGELHLAAQTAALSLGEATVSFGDGAASTIPLADLRLVRGLE